MELTLKLEPGTQVRVICDGQQSHTFQLTDILTKSNGQPDNVTVLDDPVETGRRLFAALFQPGTVAHQSLDNSPKRILFVTTDKELDAIPWEYSYGPDGFIVLDLAFVRGIPSHQRQSVPDVSKTPLHIVAVPSNPIAHEIAPLDVEGEWQRLKQNVQALSVGVTLERARPPTLEQVRRLVANKRHRVLHFMGHGKRNEKDSILIFENESGGLNEITAQEFIRRLEDTTLLVTLNACTSAAPGETEFSNLARALAERGVPYALGMRFSFLDSDAKNFSRVFYDELSRGTSIEGALVHARIQLADSTNPWAVGTPVLYTSLAVSAGGFYMTKGVPQVEEHKPPIDLFALPRAEATFHGRVAELLKLGEQLTDEPRAKLVTIHGLGGQGKTALARQAAERFAYAWPGGVLAISLEHRPSRYQFTLELARFLNVEIEGVYKRISRAFPNLRTDEFDTRIQDELERIVLSSLYRKRILLILDNAETIIEDVKVNNKDAIDLVNFLREQVLSSQSSLLITSRDHLGWTGEELIALKGLSPNEGARVFWQSAPNRLDAVNPHAKDVSRKVDGHPLSLRLLGGAFNSRNISLANFVNEVENILLQAEDKYQHDNHRHRTLFASIDTSVRYLSEENKHILGGLWIFQSSFLPTMAGAIFAGVENSGEQTQEKVADFIAGLQALAMCGLLVQEEETFADGSLLLYRVLPTLRLYARNYVDQAYPEADLHLEMGKVYFAFVERLVKQIDKTGIAPYLISHLGEDLESSMAWLDKDEQGWYAHALGTVFYRAGDTRKGIFWLEQALEIAQEQDQHLELSTLFSMARLFSSIGRPKDALFLSEQALVLSRNLQHRIGEVEALSNISVIYRSIGQPDKALISANEALAICTEIASRNQEVAILSNMALIYSTTGELDRALHLYERALTLGQEMDSNDHRGGTILNNMGMVYYNMGDFKKAMELYEKALPIRQRVSDFAGQSTTLNNMAMIWMARAQAEKALELYNKSLQISRMIESRLEEGTILSNMADAYLAMGQRGQALSLYKQALIIRQEVFDKAGEAMTLSGIALIYQHDGQLQDALSMYEKALVIAQEISDSAAEAMILGNLATLYYVNLSNPEKAALLIEEAINILQTFGLPRDAGGATLENMKMLLNAVKTVDPKTTTRVLRQKMGEIYMTTLLIMTSEKEQRNEWYERISFLAQHLRIGNSLHEANFLEALLGVIDNKKPILSKDNPYAFLIRAANRTASQVTKLNEFLNWFKRFRNR